MAGDTELESTASPPDRVPHRAFATEGAYPIEDLSRSHAHAEIELSDGVRLSVELSNHDDADRLAQRALTAAAAEIDKALHRREQPVSHHPNIIGRSAPMLALFRMLERIRNSD